MFYNDCYNSAPEAARAMLNVLRDRPARRRIAIPGEMPELGHWAEPLHRDVGTYAAESGVNVLAGIRGAASHKLDAAQRAGLRSGAAFFFEDPAEAAGISTTPPADVAQALLPAVSRLVSTPARRGDSVFERSVGRSADAAGRSACATSLQPNTCEKNGRGDSVSQRSAGRSACATSSQPLEHSDDKGRR